MVRSTRRTDRRSFGMVEVAISTLIVAGLMVVALEMVGHVASNRAAQRELTVGYTLAEDLMTEVLAQAYKEGDTFGPEAGETGRATFDDVDDYHNWTENPPQSRDGNKLDGLDGWKRRVQVFAVTPSEDGSALSGAAKDTGLRAVFVEVSNGGNVLITLRSMIAERSK